MVVAGRAANTLTCNGFRRARRAPGRATATGLFRPGYARPYRR